MCEYPAGFVEPYPAFFDKMRDLAHVMGDRLGKLDTGFSDPAVAKGAAALRERQSAFFRHFESTMNLLATLARKELAAQPFTEAEQVFLKGTIARHGGSGPPTYDGWYPTLIYGGDQEKYEPTIADVYTYPGDMGPPEVLEVGTGRTKYVVVAVDNENERALYVGPVFSYFEFSVPPEQRLTDEKWAQAARTARPPDWERTFQMPQHAWNLHPVADHEFPMTAKARAEFESAAEDYQALMRSYPRNATPAQRLKHDKRVDEVRKRLMKARGCGCPPDDPACPCLSDR
jgi:hypothetical protein